MFAKGTCVSQEILNPFQSDTTEHNTEDTVGDVKTETKDGNGKYWLIAGGVLLIVMGLVALFLFLRAKKTAKKEQRRQSGHGERLSSLSIHPPPIIITTTSEQGKSSERESVGA